MADDDRKTPRRFGVQDPAFIAPDPNAQQSTAQKVFVSAEYFVLSLAARIFALFRPFVPYLVPVAVSLAVLPVLAFFSFLAGYVVWKSSAVTWEHPLYLQYGDGVPPYSDIRLNVAANQPYDVNLQLVVPDLPSNFALGNFMASISIATLSNRTLVSSRRPSIVLPPTASVIPFWNRKNSVGVNIPLLVDQTIGASRVIAHIEVGRRDNWKAIGNGEGRELSVLSATLQGIVKHQGLRGLFTRNPLLAGYIASGSFFILSAIVVFGFLVNATSLFTPYQYELVEAPPVKRSKSQDALEERVARRRRGSSKHSSRSFEEIKEEAKETTIPDAEDWESSLRRRSTRGSVADEQNE